MDECIEHTETSKKKTLHLFLNNSDSEELTINKFEKTDSVLDAQHWKNKEKLISDENRNISLIVYGRSPRKYRCNSVVQTNVQDLVFYEKNIKLLSRLRAQAAENIALLIDECIYLHSKTGDSNQKEILEDLIVLILKFRDSSIIKLRESLCEMLFKKSMELDTFVEMKAPPSLTFTLQEIHDDREYVNEVADELGASIEGNNQIDEKTFKKHFKTLLGKFRYTISHVAHYIHYYHLANSSGKKFSMNRDSSPTSVNDIETMLDSPLIKISRRISIKSRPNTIVDNHPIMIDRINSKKAEEDEMLVELKSRLLKNYFYWKLDRWAHTEMENIKVACRICSKKIHAKKLKNHSKHCKNLLECEHKINELNTKIAELSLTIVKYKRNINVDLTIERNSLIKIKRPVEEEKKLTGTTLLSFKSQAYLPNISDDYVESKSETVKPQNTVSIAELIDEEDESTPFHRYSPGDNGELNFSSMVLATRKETQETAASRKYTKESSVSEPLNKGALNLGSNTTLTSLEREDSFQLSPIVVPEGNAESAADNKNVLNLDFEPKMDLLEIPIITSPAKKKPFLKRSSSLQVNTVESALGDIKSSSGTKMESAKCTEFPIKQKDEKYIEEQRKMQNVLREKLQKIKNLNILTKGYETLHNYISLIQNFEEYTTESKILIEDAKKDIMHHVDQINDDKYRSLAPKLLDLIKKKIDLLKDIQNEKKELEVLDQVETPTNNEIILQTRNKRSSSFTSTMDEDISVNGDSLKLDSYSNLGEVSNTSSPTKRRNKKFKAKSVEKAKMTVRFEVFESNMRKIVNTLRKAKAKGGKNKLEKKRLSLLNNSEIKKVLYGDDEFKKSNPRSPDKSPRKKSIFSQLAKSKTFAENIEEETQPKSSLLERRRMRKNTLDEELLQEMPKVSKYNRRPSFTGDLHLKLDRKFHPFAVAEESSSDSDSSSSSSSSSDSSDGIEDLLIDERVLGNDNIEDELVKDAVCFSDDPSTLKKYCNKKKELSHLIRIEDFEFIKMISKGAFGKVWLVKRKATDDIYAMKMINFSDRMNRNNIDSLKKEKKVFQVLQGNWVVKAVFTFVHESYLCIVMEFLVGGDFGNILEKFCALEEWVARFYIAEVILALDSLHQLGIVHRDLKPDNILLGADGHIKLTDFGLSEVGVQQQKRARTNTTTLMESTKSGMESPRQARRDSLSLPALPQDTNKKLERLLDIDQSKAGQNPKPEKTKGGNRIVGTPDYIPPEIIEGKSYDDPAIDWWSVGVLLFEFLVGVPPFNADKVEEVFDNILHRRIPWDDISIGYDEDCITPEAKSLIDGLLTLDRSKRLGSKGVQEIKDHPFFKGFDWENILSMKPPIIPETNNKFDVSNFKKENREYRPSEIINPFHDKGHNKHQNVNLDADTFEFARYDILHEENSKVVEDTKKLLKSGATKSENLRRRKWSVWDDNDDNSLKE